MYSPDKITHLEDNQIFVFGSNTEGKHGAGAAKLARKWGATYGCSRGLMGKTYGIVTKNLKKGKRSISLKAIEDQIEELFLFAEKNPELEFLVTAIGCGLSGYTPSEITPLLKGKTLPPNILLPKVFGIKNSNYKKVVKDIKPKKKIEFERVEGSHVLGKI
jgi:hypothetical protein